MGEPDFVTIDGSYGEGGGQILRTALSLSSLMGKPLRIVNIRANRPKPGLRPQHLTAVRAMQEVCDAKVEGARVNSTTLEFLPGQVRGGEFVFDISKEQPSAGSITLVLQTILPPLLFANKPSSVKILRGGTHVPMSPPFDYVDHVFVPMLARMGAHVKLKLIKAGWYPKGGGEVEVVVMPVEALEPLLLTDRGKLKCVKCVSIVSNLKRSIAERQVKRAQERLSATGISVETELIWLPSVGEGTGTFITAELDNCLAGFSSLGEIGKPAEKVADEAVEQFRHYWQSGALVDKNLCDQLLLYLALAKGRSQIQTAELSLHALTNIWVIEKFLPVKFEVQGKQGEPATISVDGIGFERALSLAS